MQQLTVGEEENRGRRPFSKDLCEETDIRDRNFSENKRCLDEMQLNPKKSQIEETDPGKCPRDILNASLMRRFMLPSCLEAHWAEESQPGPGVNGEGKCSTPS